MFSSIKIPHVRNYFLYFMKSLLLEMSLSEWIAPFTTHEDVIATILSLLAFHIQPKSRLCVFMFKILHDFCLTSFGFFFLGILPAVVVFSIPLWLLMLSLKKKKKRSWYLHPWIFLKTKVKKGPSNNLVYWENVNLTPKYWGSFW